MRFTVHDSPDYYQLKVSVFNDDKKTELIGETWVALESMIKPGGGKNDVWHALNCKGRYAGDIRIELTYYDSRPKEEKTEERRQSAPLDSTIGQASTSVGGPRQLKPVKRRPLPADPVDSSRSSPLPSTPQNTLPSTPNTQQRYAESPDDFGFEQRPAADRRRERVQNSQARGSPLASQQQQPMAHSGDITMMPSPHPSTPSRHDIYNSPDPNMPRQDQYDLPNHTSQSGYPDEYSGNYEIDHVDDWEPRPLAQPLQASQGMVHAHSLPAMIDARPRHNASQMQPYLGSSPPKGLSYDESPNYDYDGREDHSDEPNVDQASMDHQDAPPPPPVHRNSGSRSSHQAQMRGVSDPYTQIPATAPLNIRNGRGSMTASPLSHTHSHSPSYPGYAPSTSPSISHSYSQPAPSVSSRTSYGQLNHQRSQSPIRDYEQSMPPSLMPGYEPSIAEDESERIIQENRMAARHHYSDPPRPQFQPDPPPIDPSLPQYQQATAPVEPQYQQAPAPAVYARQQPRPRNVDQVQSRRQHRASAPVMQPISAGPDPRTPVRKSVSPSPGSAPAERRHSEIPFSPDSFDAFNPSINKAASVNEPGARYNTPDQAKEAVIQHERQEKLGDGPIIGNDGRIIDPSDHLPTDTWAPEPEQKAPKKGPQITMRFRHSPQGAQPMPAPRRPTVEHSVSTPIYPPTQVNASPEPVARARLQKRTLATTGHPTSSPAVPTLNTTPRSSPLRTSESSYPLQERENFGGYGSSPTYGRSSQGNIPPPIPGKIPIGGGQEDWDTSALSEEMKRIDIGVGGGQGRQRRSRYGF